MGRVGGHARLEPLGGGDAVQAPVLDQQGRDLRQVRFARAEVARDPDADLGRVEADGVGESFEKVVEVAFDRGRDDVAADLGGQLVLVLPLGDLDHRLDPLLDPGLEDVADTHAGPFPNSRT